MTLSQNIYAKCCGPKTASNYVPHGKEKMAVLPLGTSAQAVEPLRMEPRSALAYRKLHPLMPYKADAWEHELQSAGILERFAKIPVGF